MGAMIENAAAILSIAQQRVEIAGQNIANAVTPGYRRRIGFETLLAGGPRSVSAPIVGSAPDLSPGKQIQTGNPYDLAISGEGFFAVRQGEEIVYTRGGQFQRDQDGRLVTVGGAVLQGEAGDLVVRGQSTAIASDGAVLDAGEIIARIPLFAFPAADARWVSGEAFTVAPGSAQRLERAAIRQGALESSNVTSGDEMVSMMEALRRAETAQRLVNVYDDLMGRAISNFGQV